MLSHPPVKFILTLFLIALVATTGCIYPRQYQHNKPFVFKTNINIQGNLSAIEKQDLEGRLENQLDDSLKTKLVTTFPLRKKLVKPPVFDTASANHTQEFMKSLLYALGYYKGTVTWDSFLVVKGDQQRVTVDFFVTPGKGFKFDSITYRLEDSALQALVMSPTRRANSVIKRGDPYSIEAIAEELDRMVEIFRNQGYYKFNRDDLLAERDTVFAALIDPSLDPFERIQLLQQAQERAKNPTMNLVIKLRNPNNTSHFRKYYIRNVSIYPDLSLIEDTIAPVIRRDTIDHVIVSSRYDKFKPKFIASRNTLRPKDLYRYRTYVRTYSNYTQLDAWAQAGIDITEAKDSSPNLDVLIRLYPDKKQDISVTLDGSYNTGDVLAAGNLFGVGVNLGLNNRNVAKQAIQSSTNLRTGVELGKNFIQTIQATLSHTISYPRFILPQWLMPKNSDSLLLQRTQLNFNAGYTNRRTFYELRSLNASWGYSATKRVNRRLTYSYYFSPLNIEYVQLNQGQKLKELIASAPNLAYSFNNGLVLGNVVGALKYQQTRNNKTSTLQLGFEESGALFGSIGKLDKDANLFRFIKFDIDYRHHIDFKKSSWAFRLYGGLGISYGKDEKGNRELQLPFFKAFYGGGPYSMRAWQVRQLGVGSAKYFDTLSTGVADRFGDMQLEGNVEYRFDVGTFFGVVKLKSALFADVGNIWLRNNLGDSKFDSAVFKLSRLYTDLAVAGGTSLRFDFDAFLIRFDWAYKLKNPFYAQVNSGWFQKLELLKGQFQLGINYPF